MYRKAQVQYSVDKEKITDDDYVVLEKHGCKIGKSNEVIVRHLRWKSSSDPSNISERQFSETMQVSGIED